MSKDYSLSSFIKNFSDSKVVYDKSFQRRVVWESQNTNKYFESLSKDWALQSIVVADIDACKEHCNQMGELTSAEYFSTLLPDGKKYISLDGQNRTKKTLGFFNNEVAISGKFLDADGEIQHVQNSFFKDLPKRLQDHFKTGCKVTVQVVEKATKDDLSSIFQSLNDGKPLNDQEMRQAIKSPIADWVRKTSSKYSAMLEYMVPDKQRQRMIDDETVAKIAMVLMKTYNHKIVKTREWGLKASLIDDWYEMGAGFNTLSDPTCCYIAEEITRVDEIIKSMAVIVTHQKTYSQSKQIPKRLWWATLLACEWAHDNDFEIQGNAKFFKELKVIEDRLVTDSESLYAKDRETKLRNGLDPDDVNKEHYYFRWQNLPHQPSSRNKRKDALILEVSKTSNLSKLTLRKKSVNMVSEREAMSA